MKKNRSLFASVIFFDAKPVKFFLNEISTQKSLIKFNQWCSIETMELKSPNEVIKFLEYFEGQCHAQEIEI